jgi:hypothetical protein
MGEKHPIIRKMDPELFSVGFNILNAKTLKNLGIKSTFDS